MTVPHDWIAGQAARRYRRQTRWWAFRDFMKFAGPVAAAGLAIYLSDWWRGGL